jgi:hypothetical protein
MLRLPDPAARNALLATNLIGQKRESSGSFLGRVGLHHEHIRAIRPCSLAAIHSFLLGFAKQKTWEPLQQNSPNKTLAPKSYTTAKQKTGGTIPIPTASIPQKTKKRTSF